LSDKARMILFWFTICMLILVVVVAVITILRSCGGTTTPAVEEVPFEVIPAEVTVCIGEQHQFTTEGDVEVTWEVTGGTISASGLFTASDAPGDYTITATRSDSRQTAEAIVHAIVCTPTPTPVLSPTIAPTPTASPTPEAATAPPPADAQDDVGTYESGAPVEGVPAGVDIRTASARSDLHVVLQPTEGVPAELTDWTTEGEVLLWITLYEPVPDPPEVYTEWLFALDLDGDAATGRPVGSARINPDLGTEAAIGVYYDPASGEYVSYFLVWDPAQESLVPKPDVPRFTLDESRTQVGLAMPLEILAQTVEQTTGVTVLPEEVKGRAAVLSYVGEQGVVDFYPDRPE